MKIQNNTQTTFIHEDLTLLPDGAITEVKNEKIAKIWLAIDGVVEYIAPEDVKAKTKELEDENAKLKAELEKLKEAKAEKEPVEEKKATKKK